MDDACTEIIDVAPQSLNGVAQSVLSIGSLVYVVLEDLIATQESLQFMSVGVFVHADAGRDEVFRFEGAVCHHGEDINDVVSEAIGVVVAVLAVVVHFEFAAGHLGYAVVHGLAGVDCGFEVGIVEG